MAKETLEKFERTNSEKKEDILRKLDIKDEIDKVNNNNDSLKEMMEKHNNNKEVSSSIQIICRKSEIDLQKEKEFFLKQNIKRQKDIIETKEEAVKVKEEIEQELTDIIVQDKAKEMIEIQNNEKLCRKTKDMLIENSAFEESLRRKLDTKNEIGRQEKQ